MKYSTVIALGLILFLTSCGGSSEKVTLRLAPEKNTEFCITTSTEALGGAMDFSSGGKYCFTAEEINGSTIRFSVKADLTQMDTGDDDFFDEEILNELDLIDDETYSITLNEKGGIAENFTDQDGLPFTELVDMTNLQVQFPDQALGEGDSWEVDQQPTLLGQPVKAIYKVEDIMEDRVVLAYTGKIGGGSVLGAMTKTGEYVIDRKTGLVLNGSFESKLMTGGKAVFTFKQTR